MPSTSRTAACADRWDQEARWQALQKRFGNCRHYYSGHYYETPWWTLPLIIGGSIAAQNNYDGDGYGSRHVEWCLDRYRSYNPRNNTWVSLQRPGEPVQQPLRLTR